MTGNVIELSVAVILAGAVGGVVKGFTEYIMMPLVGQFTGGMDFSGFKLVLSPAVYDEKGVLMAAENAVLYGTWTNRNRAAPRNTGCLEEIVCRYTAFYNQTPG
jgi:large conductance mechanosensitive channel